MEVMQYKSTIIVVLNVVLFILPFYSYAQKAGNLNPFHPMATSIYRPQYHFTPVKGWMGDPDGLIFANGSYNLFYWGHARSKDLVHWHRLPRALTGVMSGSVVIDRKNSSDFGKAGQKPWVAIFSIMNPKTRVQSQAIAYSLDKGITWKKYKGNPVLSIGSTQFRDPQVFWYQPQKEWIMIVALSAKRKVAFYKSKNLKQWTKLSEFGHIGAINGVWECPDLFPIQVKGKPNQKKWILEVDVQPIGGQYFVGDFNGTRFILDPKMRKDLKSNSNLPKGKLLFGINESHFKGWAISGNAFGERPAKSTLHGQNPVFGYLGGDLSTVSIKGIHQPELCYHQVLKSASHI